LAAFVDHLAAMAPEQPVGVVVAVADGLAMREAGRGALGLHRLAEFEETGGILREFVEAGGLHMAIAIDDGIADGAERQGDEFSVALGIALQTRIPAAIGTAEILAELRQVDQLVRI